MRSTAILLAAISWVTFGAECTKSDLAPFNAQFTQCSDAAGFSSSPTPAEIDKSCNYKVCVELFQAYATLKCTFSGSPASNIGKYCDLVSPTPTTLKPSPSMTTKTPTSGNACTSADYVDITPLMEQCDQTSGIANLTSTNLPVWCSYKICVTAAKAYASLTCTVKGKPANSFSTICDPYTLSPTTKTTTTLTPSSTNNNVATKECSTNDLPVAFAQQQQSCLSAGGISTIPTTISGLVGLCKHSECISTLKLFDGLTCTFGGISSSVVAAACEGYSPLASPKTTIPSAPSSSPSFIVSYLTLLLVMALAIN